MKKWSSFKKQQILTENFRKFLEGSSAEEEYYTTGAGSHAAVARDQEKMDQEKARGKKCKPGETRGGVKPADSGLLPSELKAKYGENWKDEMLKCEDPPWLTEDDRALLDESSLEENDDFYASFLAGKGREWLDQRAKDKQDPTKANIGTEPNSGAGYNFTRANAPKFTKDPHAIGSRPGSKEPGPEGRPRMKKFTYEE